MSDRVKEAVAGGLGWNQDTELDPVRDYAFDISHDWYYGAVRTILLLVLAAMPARSFQKLCQRVRGFPVREVSAITISAPRPRSLVRVWVDEGTSYCSPARISAQPRSS